jgi:hypothetical protein
MTISVCKRVVLCPQEVVVFVAKEGRHRNEVVQVPHECYLCQEELGSGFPEVRDGEVICPRAGSARKEM